MLNNAILFLLETLLDLLTLAFLLRFYFQLAKVSFQHQVAQLIVTITNFAVKPMRRLVPSMGKFDLSTLLLACVTQFVLIVCIIWLQGFPILIAANNIWLTLFVVALIGVVSMSTTLFMYAVLIQAILSWVAPYTPIAPILSNLTQPILNFLRKFIPTAGNVDLSPLVFIITAQLLLTTILMPLKNNLLSML
jgi:YggT family protein